MTFRLCGRHSSYDSSGCSSIEGVIRSTQNDGGASGGAAAFAADGLTEARNKEKLG